MTAKLITESPKCPMNLSRDLLGGKLEQLAELDSGPVGPRDGKKFGDKSAARTLARASSSSISRTG